MKTIVRHLICKVDPENITGSINLHKVKSEDHVYLSGNWTINVNDAKKLVGGKLYLHREKDTKSFFGVHVLDIDTIIIDNKEKVIFKFKAERAAKNGRRWEGKYEPKEFCMDSGNVEVDL